MSHYFKTDENLKDEDIKITWQYRDQVFHFSSNSGIFSKDKIDKGSKQLLDYLLSKQLENSLLDVGCGYGVLGIVIKKFFPELQVTMVDVNERALAATAHNCQVNVVNCHIYYSDLYSKVQGKYDYIISNPPIRAGKKVVEELIIQAKKHLSDTGVLVLVVRKQQGALSWLSFVRKRYGNGEIVAKHQGYCVIQANKA